jgi:hypothetical protein
VTLPHAYCVAPAGFPAWRASRRAACRGAAAALPATEPVVPGAGVGRFGVPVWGVAKCGTLGRGGRVRLFRARRASWRGERAKSKLELTN